MQFTTLLSIYVAIAGAVAAPTEDPLALVPACARSKLTAAFAVTGCTSPTDTACWCSNAVLKIAVTNIVGTTSICSASAHRKLIGDLWNDKCPDKTVHIA
ncbi:hypothetical protein KVR01_004736 [Diaporthe batatas]|uniref:uncharacterized protein n=1 Tax=Diaporthe batatas TaxID=748121 RepID=UPI001D03DC02|nr:uncharacterized protein KVR01_004736 [Diaporthe batatas]KAG8166184.1 hypothetical protein KVR01_004736 [Diaporthe batatas]